VQVRNSAGKVQIETDEDPGIAYEGPLALLVDRDSASASEIFAGAIQDYKRGIIIGETTFGKGTVQNLIDLNRYDHELEGHLGQLKTTIAQFFRVAGASTQHRGVVPDLTLPAANDPDDQGERALDNALPWDQIQAASYTPEPGPALDVDHAHQLHLARLKTDPMLKILTEELAAVESALRKDRLSLLGSKRKAEQDTEEATHLDRVNQIRKLRALRPLAPGDEEDEKEIYDVLLHEAANVLHDMIEPTLGTAGPRTAAAPQDGGGNGGSPPATGANAPGHAAE
jgi:carboxyl-terminal processing protease